MNYYALDEALAMLEGKEVITEGVKEVDKYFSTGLKVKGKEIRIYKFRDEPNKEQVEAYLSRIKAAVKIINSKFDEILEAAVKRYMRDGIYADSESKAKKELKFDGINCSYYKNCENSKYVSFSAFFSSAAMDKDMHTLTVELDVYDSTKEIHTETIIDG